VSLSACILRDGEAARTLPVICGPYQMRGSSTLPQVFACTPLLPRPPFPPPPPPPLSSRRRRRECSRWPGRPAGASSASDPFLDRQPGITNGGISTRADDLMKNQALIPPCRFHTWTLRTFCDLAIYSSSSRLSFYLIDEADAP